MNISLFLSDLWRPESSYTAHLPHPLTPPFQGCLAAFCSSQPSTFISGLALNSGAPLPWWQLLRQVPWHEFDPLCFGFILMTSVLLPLRTVIYGAIWISIFPLMAVTLPTPHPLVSLPVALLHMVGEMFQLLLHIVCVCRASKPSSNCLERQ